MKCLVSVMGFPVTLLCNKKEKSGNRSFSIKPGMSTIQPDSVQLIFCILKVFDKNQDEGKSIVPQNDNIGCVELVLAQGFK